MTFDSSPHVSYLRSGCNTNAVRNIVELCQEFGLKIVTNSMHNYYDIGDSSLKEDLITWGIPENLFHDEWRTIFPVVDYTRVNSPIRGAGRMYAIEQWLLANPGYEWICFDDRKFTDDPRLIHIDRDYGVDAGHLHQARSVLKEMLG